MAELWELKHVFRDFPKRRLAVRRVLYKSAAPERVKR